MEPWKTKKEKEKITEKIEEGELKEWEWCHYSGMPSPSFYENLEDE